MDLSPFFIPFLSAIASFFGAWLAAHFALTRFYRERIWERKVAAYSAIFTALHDIGAWYSKHLEAHMKDREIPDADKEKLRQAARDAEDELERKLAAETWLIPDNCRNRITKLTRDLSNHYTTDWIEHLTTGETLIYDGVTDLRAIVRADLGLAGDQ